jgi:hypothetical protein
MPGTVTKMPWRAQTLQKHLLSSSVHNVALSAREPKCVQIARALSGHVARSVLAVEISHSHVEGVMAQDVVAQDLLVQLVVVRVKRF